MALSHDQTEDAMDFYMKHNMYMEFFNPQELWTWLEDKVIRYVDGKLMPEVARLPDGSFATPVGPDSDYINIGNYHHDDIIWMDAFEAYKETHKEE